MTPPARRTRTALLALAAAVGFVSTAGCLAYRPFYDEGGSGASIDEYTYISDTWSPKTVSLIDVRTDETIWTVDIPVGKQLSMRFYVDDSPETPATPDLMRWGLFDAGTRFGGKRNEMLVPPSSIRRIDLSIRPVPEYPPAEDQ